MRPAAVSAQSDKPETEQGPPRRWAAIAALRHRNYRLFWGGQIISLIGTWMQTVAQGYLVYHLTHSAVLLGVVTTLATLDGVTHSPRSRRTRVRHRQMRPGRAPVTVCVWP